MSSSQIQSKDNYKKMYEKISEKINTIRYWAPHYHVQSSLVPQNRQEAYQMSDRIIRDLHKRFKDVDTAGEIPYFSLEYIPDADIFLMEESDKEVPSMKIHYCLIEGGKKHPEQSKVIKDLVFIGNNDDERINLVSLPDIPSMACRLIQKGARSPIWFLCAEEIGERLYVKTDTEKVIGYVCPMLERFRTSEITPLDRFYIWISKQKKYEFRIQRAYYES